MMRISRKQTIGLSAVFVSWFAIHSLHAQGLPRRMGVGVRAGLWKPSHVTDEYDLDFLTISVSDDVGRSGALYAFTRLADNWYVESEVGSDGGTYFTVLDAGGIKEGSARVTPLLFGGRYDWLPERYDSILQPYVSAGLGMYWVSQEVTGAVAGPATLRIRKDTRLEVGGYAGVGMHVVLRDRLALNLDAKYHLIGFRAGRGYSGFQVGGGICFLSGRKKEPFRVEGVNMVVTDVYPAYYPFYRTYPLALVTVKSVADYPVELTLISEIPGYSERPQESGTVRLGPRAKKDIPVYVLFGESLLTAAGRGPAVLDILLEARTGPEYRQTFSAELVIHSRNAWDGAVEKLGFFLTPDDPAMLEMGGRAAGEIRGIENGSRQPFLLGMRVFDALGARGIRYQSDPSIPFYRDDRVQFASETLERKAGDCDDLVVLLASLLQSAGIRTAFVDVQDPGKTVAHVYLMFDTGVPPEEGHRISRNEKRYVIREDSGGSRTAWIPVEATLVEEGFEEAWRAGARAYLEEGLLRHGLADGWVRVIDVR